MDLFLESSDGCITEDYIVGNRTDSPDRLFIRLHANTLSWNRINGLAVILIPWVTIPQRCNVLEAM